MYKMVWIHKDIGNHYFHRSGILYRFLRSYENNHNRSDLRRQFFYITRIFPARELMYQLLFVRDANRAIHSSDRSIVMADEDYRVSLHIGKRQITFHCDMLQDAEELLFSNLRLNYFYLFIWSMERERYG